MKLKLLIIVTLTIGGLYAKGFVQDVRNAFENIDTFCKTSRYSRLPGIEEYGISDQDLASKHVLDAVSAVSNNWQEVLADWDYYRTNEVATIFLKKIICYSGTNAYLGVWSGLLDINAENESRCPRELIFDFAFPAYAPLHHYAQLNYDIYEISNCLYRTSILFTNETRFVEFFGEILSGLAKARIESELTLEDMDWSQ